MPGDVFTLAGTRTTITVRSVGGNGIMRKRFIGFVATMALSLAGAASALAQNAEQKIWTLLDDPRAVYVSLPEADFRSMGAGMILPDGGRAVTALAQAAPGGAFDPRDVARIPAATLGYKAD